MALHVIRFSLSFVKKRACSKIYNQFSREKELYIYEDYIMGLPAKLSITNSNYFDHGKLEEIAPGDFNKENMGLESIVSGRVSMNTSILEGGILSLDLGIDRNQSFGENSTSSVSPFTELKYKQNILKYGNFTLRGYGRQRVTGEKIQERVSLGGSYKLNDEISVYADGHYTAKFGPNSFNHKVGCWFGIDYSPKWAKGLNIWLEPVQINHDLSSGNRTIASNGGISFSPQQIK